MSSFEVPERGKIRRMLDELLVNDSDIDAFCIDHFPEVRRRFAAGMDRVAKLNLLLVHTDGAEVLDKVRKQQAAAPITADAARLAKIEALAEQREAALFRGDGTDRIDEEIRALKRLLRQGPRLSAGEILDGRYKLREVVGSGGFADVWLAWDRKLAQSVAVKVLHGHFTPEKIHWQRFARGARNMAKLSQRHPGFVKVLGDPAEDGGYHYFVMEYLPEGDLRQAVLSGRLSQDQALGTILTVAEALHFAHEQGLIHRDVKPQNILLDKGGAARLGDFDLVAAPDSTGGTRTGPLGTFIYAAPEELEDATSVDRRTDVYSLGMTAVFTLYSRDLPHKVIRSPVDFVAELSCSPAIKEVLTRAISWEAAERQPTAEKLRKELAVALLSTARPVLPDPYVPEASALGEYAPLRLPLPGERIGGYTIKRKLYQGETASIYEAIDGKTKQLVAIKILLPELSVDPAIRSQVFLEAHALLGIRHPGIVRIIEYVEQPNHLTYIVGEHLDGPTLRQRRAHKGVLSIEEVLPMAHQMASAMDILHKSGIVHGNLTPDKFILILDRAAPGGERVKLLDLSGARLIGRSAANFVSHPNSATPIYIAPEQIRGTGAVDGRADVYAFGVILYELLAGKPPLAANLAMQEKHPFENPTPLREVVPSVPKPLSDLLERMLNKQPEHRPSMKALTEPFATWELEGRLPIISQ